MKLAYACLILPLTALTFAPALAQIAPPPGPAPAPTPEWNPPKPTTKLPANPDTRLAEERMARLPKLPDLPYDSLVKRDSANKVIRPKEPIQIAALRNNPSIDAETRNRLVAVLGHRQAKADRLAIENLDLVDKIEGGAIDRLEGGDSKAFNKAMFDLSRPLRPADNELNVDLRRSFHITYEQSRWSQQLWQEYNKAVGDEIRQARSTSGPDTRPYQKFLELQRIEETLMAHPRLLVEASRSLDKTLPQLALSADTSKKIDPIVKALGSKDDAGREQSMREIAKHLTLPQRQDLLRKTMALRPPLPAIQNPPAPATAPAQPVPADDHPADEHNPGEAQPAAEPKK